MRKRRDTVVDWVGNALKDLKETREEIGQYGIGDHFLKESLEKMKRM